eukprot:1790074-Karenia_brevis.AAC.1
MLGGTFIDVQTPHWWTNDPHTQRISITTPTARAEEAWRSKHRGQYQQWANIRDHFDLLPGTITTAGTPHPYLYTFLKKVSKWAATRKTSDPHEQAKLSSAVFSRVVTCLSVAIQTAHCNRRRAAVNLTAIVAPRAKSGLP